MNKSNSDVAIVISKRNVALDFIRAVSAFLVVISHIRAGFFVDYSQAGSADILAKAFYVITGLGHEAVLVFFVLSGYFVGGSILDAGSRFRWLSYVIARLTRLWIVLLPSLIFSGLIAMLLEHRDATFAMGAHFADWGSGPSSSKDYSRSFSTFLGNIAFLQTIFVPVFSANGPLWSLANEFWYYLLFPLGYQGFLLLRQRNIGRELYIYILAAVAILIGLPADISVRFLVWLVGVGAAYLVRNISYRGRMLAPLSISIFLVLILLMKSNRISAGYFFELIAALAFSFFVVGLEKRKKPLGLSENKYKNLALKLRSLAIFLSDSSYTLYLFHFPILLMILVFGGVEAKWSFGSMTIFCLALITAFVYFLCFLAWYLFERHTASVRKYVENEIFSLKSKAN